MEPRTQYARTIEGVNIAYAVFGTGPAIVFPSHMFGSLHLYKERGALPRIYDDLASLGWSAITYDGRGCGSSDRDVSDYSMEARLRDLDAVIERAAPDQFAMCGVIQGGPAAIAYSILHPDRVTNLVLSNTFAFGPEWYEVVPAMRAFRKMASMAEDDWEFFTLSVGSAVTNHSDAGAARKAAEVFRAGMTAKAWTDYQKEAELVDLRGNLSEIAPPTLVVHDRSFPLARVADVVKRLTAMIPDAQFVETDDLAKVIDEFLREGGLNPVMGERAAASRPSAFRTILFTDLVGHTEMMQRLGDEGGRDVLREHDQITREVLKANGGTEVKTMGDGFMASFGSVTRAVECAIALQRAFTKRNESVAEPLNVRVGLNAGEPIEEEGDLFGSTVILAARIASAAQGGEILASMAVRELCAGKGFLFSDRGEFVAKGFEEPVRMFEVSWRS